MRTLLQFLEKYSILLLFLVLETVAFILLVRHNNYPQSAVLSSANRLAASLYEMNSSVVGYFSLSKQNDILAEENVALLMRVSELENMLEQSVEDSVLRQYIYADQDYQFIAAKVINSTNSLERNYLTINKGERDGVGQDMAVIATEGAVGIVRETSEKYAVVIPIVNPLLSVSCKLKRNGYTGTLHWSGGDYRYADLHDIARHIDVMEGDTVVTSGLSKVFPADLPIGVISKAELSESDAYNRIEVRLAVDLGNLRYVTIAKNRNQQEQLELEKEVVK